MEPLPFPSCDQAKSLQLVQHPLFPCITDLIDIKNDLTLGDYSNFIPRLNSALDYILDWLTINENNNNELDIFMRHLAIGILDQVWELRSIQSDFQNQLDKLYSIIPLNSSDSREYSEGSTLSSNPHSSYPSSAISKPRRRSTRGANHPSDVTELLTQWLLNNKENPYPSRDEKLEFCDETGLRKVQLDDWFTNARRRVLKRGKQSNITDLNQHS